MSRSNWDPELINRLVMVKSPLWAGCRCATNLDTTTQVLVEA